MLLKFLIINKNKMNNNFKQGILKRWDDNRGFGFIAQKNGKDIFLHISAFKRAGCRPSIGNSISYQVHTDNTDKVRAINASIDGVKARKPNTSRRQNTQNKRSLMSEVMIICLVLMLGVFLYRVFIENNVMQVNPVVSAPTSASFQQNFSAKRSAFSCNGKVYCSQMTSCTEATFYQKNCVGTKMDGDGDGIPCESQWCR